MAVAIGDDANRSLVSLMLRLSIIRLRHGVEAGTPYPHLTQLGVDLRREIVE